MERVGKETPSDRMANLECLSKLPAVMARDLPDDPRVTQVDWAGSPLLPLPQRDGGRREKPDMYCVLVVLASMFWSATRTSHPCDSAH
jgi:hypothetical protein